MYSTIFESPQRVFSHCPEIIIVPAAYIPLKKRRRATGMCTQGLFVPYSYRKLDYSCRVKHSAIGKVRPISLDPCSLVEKTELCLRLAGSVGTHPFAGL